MGTVDLHRCRMEVPMQPVPGEGGREGGRGGEWREGRRVFVLLRFLTCVSTADDDDVLALRSDEALF